MPYKKISAIYKIENIVNKKIYIGSAVSVKRRFNDHKNHLNENRHHNSYLQRSWNKYGEENFKFEIIEKIENKNLLIGREQYWMNVLEPEYNICKFAGSSLGIKRTDEEKERISKTLKGRKIPQEVREKISKTLKGMMVGEKNPMFGRKVSLETRRKQSESHKGKCIGEKNPMCKLTDSIVKEIREKFDTGNFLQYKLAKEYNVSKMTICRIVNKKLWKHI